MAKDNSKSALVQMYASDEARDNAEKTFICLGVARGGTSAVGGVMQRLGVQMGENLTNNYEDLDFINKNQAHMRAAVEKRNEAHSVWGWKAPNAANYLEMLLPSVRNPHLIVVFRDTVATMKAHVRWHNRSQQLAVHEIMLQQQKNWFLLERWQIPTALVSYEKAILAPEVFVPQMADFLSVPQPDAEGLQGITEFLSPGSYK